MKPDSALNVIEKLEKPKTINWNNFIKAHAHKQQLYINSKAKTTMAWGAKRSGKTLASTSLTAIMDSRSETNARIEIASATVEKAKLLYWRNFEIINKSLSLKWEFRSGANMILTPKRDIVFRSLRDVVNADKAVGFSVLACYIEEPHTIKEKVLKHYLDNVIQINTLNIPGARINLTTNPPPFPMPWLRQRFYENKEVYKVHFTPQDNPWITDEALKKNIEQTAKDMGYSSPEEALEKSNEMKRNILGLWIEDTGRIIFEQERVQKYHELPADWHTYEAVLGVDVGGGKAKDAIVAIVYNNYERIAWVAEEWEDESANKDIQDLATKIKYFYEKYKPSGIAFDYGGLGSRLAQILSNRYGIPGVYPAIKKDKMSHLLEMRAEAYRGRLLFGPNSELYDEFPQIIFTPDLLEIDSENGLHSDLLDACLYAMRYLWNAHPEERPVKKSYKERRIAELLTSNTKKGKIGY